MSKETTLKKRMDYGTKKKNIHYRDIAKEICVTSSYIERLRAYPEYPGHSLIKRMAECLELPVSYFYEDNDDIAKSIIDLHEGLGI